MKSRWIIALLVTLMCMAAPAMAQPAPFVIGGHVYNADSNPCNDPWVRIMNTNTSVSWDANNSSTSNYYQLTLDSNDVSVGNILSIEASGCSQSKTVEHAVTSAEMGAGGFEQNLTGQAGICGDVTGNDVVDTGDVILLSNYVGYPGYTLVNEWAGDVTGNGVIDTGDVILLSNYVGYSGYVLNCTG